MGRCYKSHTLTQLLLESLQEEMDYMKCVSTNVCVLERKVNTDG